MRARVRDEISGELLGLEGLSLLIEIGNRDEDSIRRLMHYARGLATSSLYSITYATVPLSWYRCVVAYCLRNG